jgi:hypothetical protein
VTSSKINAVDSEDPLGESPGLAGTANLSRKYFDSLSKKYRCTRNWILSTYKAIGQRESIHSLHTYYEIEITTDNVVVLVSLEGSQVLRFDHCFREKRVGSQLNRRCGFLRGIERTRVVGVLPSVARTAKEPGLTSTSYFTTTAG